MSYQWPIIPRHTTTFYIEKHHLSHSTCRSWWRSCKKPQHQTWCDGQPWGRPLQQGDVEKMKKHRCASPIKRRCKKHQTREQCAHCNNKTLVFWNSVVWIHNNLCQRFEAIFACVFFHQLLMFFFNQCFTFLERSTWICPRAPQNMALKVEYALVNPNFGGLEHWTSLYIKWPYIWFVWPSVDKTIWLCPIQYG